MSALLEGYIKELTSRQNDFLETVGAPNHDVYEPKLSIGAPNFNYFPRYMYFYYVRINENGRLKVSHFYYVNGDRTNPQTWQVIPYNKFSLENIVTQLAENARKTVPDDPPPCTQINFKDILWRRKSYIAIFFDEDSWNFIKKFDQNSAIVFLTEKGTLKPIENYTFFDAMDLDIRIQSEEVKSAIIFVNHMKADEAGTDLIQGQSRAYQFNMVLNAKFEDGTDAPLQVIFDPGGTNQGPALQP